MPVRILQVGCGRWGRHVLRDLRELGADVTVVARSDESVARARDGGAARIVPGIGDADGVDGAIVVTPAWQHAEAVTELAPLGVPIFCQKPMTTGVDDARRIVDLCGERLFAMHLWRWHPGVEAIARIVSDGRLGEVEAVRSDRLGWGPFHPGVDALDTLAPHCLSIAIAVLGELPPVRAARGAPYPGGDGLGEYTALLERDGGAAVAVAGSLLSADTVRRVEVVGTLGSATLPGPGAAALDVVVHGGDPERTADRRAEPIDPEPPLIRQLRDFVAHCEGGPPPRAGAAEGLAVVQAIADVRAAASA